MPREKKTTVDDLVEGAMRGVMATLAATGRTVTFADFETAWHLVEHAIAKHIIAWDTRSS